MRASKLCGAVIVASTLMMVYAGPELAPALAQDMAATAVRPPAPPDFVPVAVRPEPVPDSNLHSVGNASTAGPQEEINPDLDWPATPRWMGDVIVTSPNYDQVKPFMDRAPDGTLYLAVEEHGDTDGWIRVWRSTDDGHTWVWTNGFKNAGGSRNPAVAVAQNPAGDNFIYIVYHAPGSNAIGMYRIPTPGGFGTFLTVATGLVATDVHPRICTDNSLWNSYYVYVTWTDNYIDYYPALFSRSTDHGATWSPPTNLTGGAQNSTRVTQPDIAFGSAGLFVAFEKLGWNGTSWTDQVWVTKSTDWGSVWTTPVQLTTNLLAAYDPSVAVAIGVNAIVVAYTYDYSTDTDVHYAYSTNGGINWTLEWTLPWTYDNERSVDVAASTSAGGRFHAAYWRDYDVEYTSADVSTPTAWSSAVLVNEANWCSGAYSRPTVCVDPRKPAKFEAGVAWTDYRGPYYQAYFDARYFGNVGDLNCDGTYGYLSFGDINPFVLYLTDFAAWQAAYPDCSPLNGDINGDGTYGQLSFGDINPFVALLSGGG
jgi:hypothetical protein